MNDVEDRSNSNSISQEGQEDTSRLEIGGSKGHVVESIEGYALELWRALRWKMIPRCTGRYTCRDHRLVSHLAPRALLSSFLDSRTMDNILSLDQYDFLLPGRSDVIIVVTLDEGQETGLITYVKKQGDDSLRYVHTLNAPSGFQRKLRAVGIEHLGMTNLLASSPAHEA